MAGSSKRANSSNRTRKEISAGLNRGPVFSPVFARKLSRSALLGSVLAGGIFMVLAGTTGQAVAACAVSLDNTTRIINCTASHLTEDSTNSVSTSASVRRNHSFSNETINFTVGQNVNITGFGKAITATGSNQTINIVNAGSIVRT